MDDAEFIAILTVAVALLSGDYVLEKHEQDALGSVSGFRFADLVRDRLPILHTHSRATNDQRTKRIKRRLQILFKEAGVEDKLGGNNDCRSVETADTMGQSSAGLLSTYREGEDYVYIGDRSWRVLEVQGDGALLVQRKNRQLLIPSMDEEESGTDDDGDLLADITPMDAIRAANDEGGKWNNSTMLSFHPVSHSTPRCLSCADKDEEIRCLQNELKECRRELTKSRQDTMKTTGQGVNEQSLIRSVHKHFVKDMEDHWFECTVGDDWPTLPMVKALDKSLSTLSGESSHQFVAMAYYNGEPVMGRVWNEKGKIKGNFACDGEERIVGSIQIMYEMPEEVRGFNYGWIQYQKLNVMNDYHPVTVSRRGARASPAVVDICGKQLLGMLSLSKNVASAGYNGNEMICDVMSAFVLSRRIKSA